MNIDDLKPEAMKNAVLMFPMAVDEQSILDWYHQHGSVAIEMMIAYRGIVERTEPEGAGDERLADITRKIGRAGNHLGCAIPDNHLHHTASADDALEKYGGGNTYDTWLAWKLIYEAYVDLERMCERALSAPVTPAEDVVEGLDEAIQIVDARCFDATDHKGNVSLDKVIKAARLHAQSQKEVRALRECVRDLAGCVATTLELRRIKGNDPRIYNSYLDKHAATIKGCE